MSESKYQDDEIKRRIEESLLEQGKGQTWKNKGNKEAKQSKLGQKKILQNSSINVPPIQLVHPPQLFAFPTFANFGQYQSFVKNLNINSGIKVNPQGLIIGESVKDSQGLTNENSTWSKSDINSESIKSNSLENDVDHFFEHALDLNKISEEETSSKSVNESKNRLNSEDINRFIDDLNKNKEIIQRSRDKITSTNMDLHLKTTKIKKSRETSPEMKLDCDLTKIPSFLNAYSYSNYFYQNNNRENKQDEKLIQDSYEQIKVFFN